MFYIQDRLLRAQISDGLKYWFYIPAAVITGGITFDLMLDLQSLPSYAAVIALAFFFIVAGIGLIQKSTRDLSTYGDGTPNPLRPPRRLVTEGSYRLCRHPMFFGYDLAALGVTLLFRSWGMLVITYPLFIYFEYRFLRNEERKLEKLFGKAYLDYRNRTPLLVPFPENIWRPE